MTGASSSATTPAGAASVESSKVEFVAFVGSSMTLLQRARALQHDRADRDHDPAPIGEPLQSVPEEVMLVSSPGFGVLDSGCGKTIVGSDTLRSFEKLWSEPGVASPCRRPEVNQFRFGNGQVETSNSTVAMPVMIAGNSDKIRVPLQTNAAGQFVLNVLDGDKKQSTEFQEVMMTESEQSSPLPETSNETVILADKD